MKKRFVVVLSLLLAACLVFSGCGAVLGAVKGKATAAPSGAVAVTGNALNAPGTVTPVATAGPAAGGQGLADAFRLVEQNPLHESVQIALWLAANAADDPAAGAAGASAAAMQQLAEKYAAVVADQGIHYVEASNALGMLVKTEYWVKGGKFKKWDGYEVILFDGEHYIKYSPEDKKGTRFDGSYAAAELQTLTKGMLASMAVSPYVQKKDAKVGKFQCSVFHMDMEMSMFGMELKGNTIYVDQKTGLIVKNQTGDPKDKKNSFAAVVESLTVGGLGDEVFTVPEGIALSDY